MNTPTYIGGAFAHRDSASFRLEKPSSVNWFLPEKSTLKTAGFETGADALAWLLGKMLPMESTSNVYFPLHYCQETLDRIQLKIPQINVLRYSKTEEIDSAGIVVWNHFNGHSPIPESLLKSSHAVIEDCVQSLVSMKQLKGKAGFTSLRKWLELDLALVISPFEQTLWSSNPSTYFTKKKEAELIKRDWKSNGDEVQEKEFLDLFSSAEEALSTPEIFSANTEDLYCYDWQKLIDKRAANAEMVIEGLKDLNLTIVGESELFVMISSKKRDELRKFLFKNGVFAPIHWFDSADKTLAGTLFSLPIDQRYNEEDMHRLISLIKDGFANSVL